MPEGQGRSVFKTLSYNHCFLLARLEVSLLSKLTVVNPTEALNSEPSTALLMSLNHGKYIIDIQ